MKIIKPSVQFLEPIDGQDILKHIEKCGRVCYIKGTEILTNSGFKPVEEITLDDNVLTYNKEKNYLEYQPSNIVQYEYNGEVICSNHSNIQFSVTPDHRMFAAIGENRDYHFIPANELVSSNKNKKRFRIPKYFKDASINNNNDYTPILLTEKEIRNGARPSTTGSLCVTLNDDWLIILSSYIAEGHSYHGEKYGSGSYIQITQTENTELFNAVLKSLNNLNINYRIEEDKRKPYIKWIRFGNQLYVKMFEELCGQYSKNKHLPDWFRFLSKRQMQIILKYLYLGDGNHNTTKNERYLSISKRLLDEVQELWILVGKNATVHYDTEKNQYCYTEESKQDSWIIHKDKHIFTKPYNGIVYCPSTSNGIVCVKYQGKTFWCGNCYKSEDKITDGSAEKFVANIIKRGHEAVLEHKSFTVKFICDRGVSHEIVRHRLASYCQESTRYCNYSKDGFGNEITVIKPCYLDEDSFEYSKWEDACLCCEDTYFILLDSGASPQEARAVLPNSLKTEVVMTANLREWRHFLKLRCSKAAHPQMREVACMLLKMCQKNIPIIFDDIVID